MRVRSGFVQKTNEQDIGKPESSVTFNDADLSDQPCKTMLFLFSLQMQIRGLLKVSFLHFNLCSGSCAILQTKIIKLNLRD